MTSTQQFGFRGRELPTQKPEGVTRIMVVGDSMIFGVGVGPEHTLPVYMEKLLNQKIAFPNFQVLNISRAGLSVLDYQQYYKLAASLFSPDIVVLVVCNNDAEVDGISNSADYVQHISQLWQPTVANWPFFESGFFSLVDHIRPLPLLVVYYGVGMEDVELKPSQVLASLCEQYRIPFLSLPEYFSWIPTNRSRVSKVDGHPSAQVHRVAATEICKKLITLGLIEKTTGDPRVIPPQPDLSGVTPEYAVETLRAWCSAHRDGVGSSLAEAVIAEAWPARVREAYIRRQLRIMTAWWSRIQDGVEFNWRRYWEHLVALDKGIHIVQVNMTNHTHDFLNNEAFFRDQVSFAAFDRLEKERILMADIQQMEIIAGTFIPVYVEQMQWVYGELMQRKKALESLEVASDPVLTHAKARLWSRWNRAAEMLLQAAEKCQWPRFFAGLDRVPDSVEKQPMLDIRVTLLAKTETMFMVNLTGYGEQPVFVNDTACTLASDAAQIFCFSFNLLDLFKAELVYLERGAVLKMEYRVALGEWQTIPLEQCTLTEKGYVLTPIYPAFL